MRRCCGCTMFAWMNAAGSAGGGAFCADVAVFAWTIFCCYTIDTWVPPLPHHTCQLPPPPQPDAAAPRRPACGAPWLVPSYRAVVPAVRTAFASPAADARARGSRVREAWGRKGSTTCNVIGVPRGNAAESSQSLWNGKDRASKHAARDGAEPRQEQSTRDASQPGPIGVSRLREENGAWCTLRGTSKKEQAK